jgi:aminoglycoside phosphotransferase (APT) family kinase protein
LSSASVAELLARSVTSWCNGATGVTIRKAAVRRRQPGDVVVRHHASRWRHRRHPAPRTVGLWRCARPCRGLDAEAVLMQLAHDAGVPSPKVLHVLKPDDDLGTGFIMQRVAGETIPRKILRDDEFADARPKLARQCGEILAGIHGLSAASLPQLRRMTAAAEIAELQREIDGFDWPRPVFQLALRWLRDHDPGPSERVTLVHGDFRHGNLMIGPDGVRAVLDWELAHLGDPMEDLGWICVNSWRFGVIDKPVGGFGTYEDLFAGYEAASGIAVDVARVKFWEVMGTLRWGVMCVGMMQRFRLGPDHSMERAMIGRRSSETEIDLLRLLAPRA